MSFSFGLPTSFGFKDKASGCSDTFTLSAGQILIMSGNCQVNFLHGAPTPLKLIPGELDFRINVSFRVQYEMPQPSLDEGLGWHQMSVEADELFIQRKALEHAVYCFKDSTFLHKHEWSRIAFNFCKSPKCSLKYCCCGRRKPEHVPLHVLSEYLDKIENNNLLEV